MTTEYEANSTRYLQEEAGNVEQHANIVIVLDPLANLIVSVLLIELGREVKEGVENSCDAVANEQKVIAPPPTLCGMEDEGCGNGSTKASCWHAEPKDGSVGEKAVSHGDELADNEDIAVARRCRQADQRLATDEGGYRLRSGADGGSNDAKERAADEEVSSPEDIAESASKVNHRISSRRDGEMQCLTVRPVSVPLQA